MQIITLEGTAYYAKVFEDNRDETGFYDAYVDCNGACTIELELDDVEYQKLQESGSKVVGKYDEDTGLHRVKFKRKFEVRNKDNEIIEDFSGPPRVVDADGNLWSHTPELPSYIGNGSRVKVAVSVSQSKKRKAIVFTRLEGVQVLELVQYNGEGQGIQLPF